MSTSKTYRNLFVTVGVKNRPLVSVTERRLSGGSAKLAADRDNHMLKHMKMEGCGHIIKSPDVSIEGRIKNMSVTFRRSAAKERSVES